MTGTSNTVVGNNAGKCITSAGQSTFVGAGAGCSVTCGSSNVAVGVNSIRFVTTGSYNTAIGISAMSQSGSDVGCNTVVGGSSGFFKGSCNISIGTYAARGSGSMGIYSGITGTNNIVIGYYAEPSSGTVSNEITLGNTTHTIVRTAGSIIPFTTNTQDLGASGNVWANIYTGDLNLSNEDGTGNSIDGTTGNWTIQEGANDLFLINNKSGKKFKFKLEEIN